jgi:enoyl-CoA hydratase/carnithine racemase
MTDLLKINRDATATQLVLNLPEKANALCDELVEALLAAVAAACGDGTRLLVLRGEGKNFCAGFDFSDLEQQSDGDLLRRFVRLEQLLQSLYHAPMATLALCHGGTYGAGADLVCACDRRVASPGTTFRMPGPRFGVVLGTRRLASRIGADAAFDILGSSRVFDAAEAQRLRFVDALAAPEAWGEVIIQARQTQTLDVAATATLKSRVQTDTRAPDLAALAESAAVPGLKQRIKNFRAEKA